MVKMPSVSIYDGHRMQQCNDQPAHRPHDFFSCIASGFGFTGFSAWSSFQTENSHLSFGFFGFLVPGFFDVDVVPFGLFSVVSFGFFDVVPFGCCFLSCSSTISFGTSSSAISQAAPRNHLYCSSRSGHATPISSPTLEPRASCLEILSLYVSARQ